MTDGPAPKTAPNAPTARRRRPGPAPVLWGSVVLFAVLFALLTHQLGATEATAPRPVVVRKVIKRRVVTSFAPGAGTRAATASPVATSNPAPEYAPITTGAS